MKQVVLGTAGHIDHGKTSLIKALTGIDTDRLKEEKIRGITIELGFAYMDLPDGTRLSIVDVPGHERFVRHMVAGASGIDLVALIIAADEGVMPQTREHLEICELLGVKKGLVVITKIDLVDEPGWIDMVKDDIGDFLKGTFLEGAPIVEVSSVTGEGLNSLRDHLSRLVKEVEPRSPAGPFRLAVDRVFTVRGFGTVVTGTSISGRLRVGDPVMIYPSGLKTRVRGLQVHNMAVNEVLPGRRTAINLQGVERSAVGRGDVVATPNSLLPSRILDVYIETLPSAPRPLKTRSKIRFHTGTSERLATIILLESEEITPGHEGYAQIHLEDPVAVLRGDRFVLRTYSPVQTIGGGEILNPVARKHKGREKKRASELLRRLQSSDEIGVILWYVRDAGLRGISENELRIRSNVPESLFRSALEKLIKEGVMVSCDNAHYVCNEFILELQKGIIEIVNGYHGRHPLRPGITKEELATQLPGKLDSKLYNMALQQLVEQKRLVLENEWVRSVSHEVTLDHNEKIISEKIREIYLRAGFQPPFFRDVSKSLPGTPQKQRDVLKWMLAQGVLIRVKEDLCYHHDVISRIKDRLIDFLKSNGEISPPQFKELIGVSRKYAIPLLEYFDSQKVTIRVGDVRRLRESQNIS